MHRQQPLSGTHASRVHGCNRMKKPSLAEFLIHDIDYIDGQRLLLPFLTTTDRLHLSECCHDLLAYRFNLTWVSVTCPPAFAEYTKAKRLLKTYDSRTNATRHSSCVRQSYLDTIRRVEPLIASLNRRRHALDQLIQRQETKGGGLQYLRVSNRELMGVLAVAPSGCFVSLKILVVSNQDLHSGDTEYLIQALLGGWLRNLEVLKLSRNFLYGNWSNLSQVIEALGQGACQQLRSLNLAAIKCMDAVWQQLGPPRAEPVALLGHTLAQALESGHLAHLQSLNLSSTLSLDRCSMTAIAKALEGGESPQLQKLQAQECDLDVEDCQALGRVIQGGRFAQLEDLDLSYNHFQDPGKFGCWEFSGRARAGALTRSVLLVCLDCGVSHVVLPGVTALGRGLLWSSHDFHQLKMLCLADVSMGPEGARALGSAFASGKISCLQIVDLHSNPMVGDEAMKEVMLGLKVCHQLLFMNVSGTNIGRMTGGALVEVLDEVAWPDLKVLNLRANGDLFENQEVSIGLVNLIEQGQLQNLEDLTIAGSGMKSVEVVRILGAVEGGQCPKLTTMLVDKNVSWKWVPTLKARGVALRRG